MQHNQKLRLLLGIFGCAVVFFGRADGADEVVTDDSFSDYNAGFEKIQPFEDVNDLADRMYKVRVGNGSKELAPLESHNQDWDIDYAEILAVVVRDALTDRLLKPDDILSQLKTMESTKSLASFIEKFVEGNKKQLHEDTDYEYFLHRLLDRYEADGGRFFAIPRPVREERAFNNWVETKFTQDLPSLNFENLAVHPLFSEVVANIESGLASTTFARNLLSAVENISKDAHAAKILPSDLAAIDALANNLRALLYLKAGEYALADARRADESARKGFFIAAFALGTKFDRPEDPDEAPSYLREDLLAEGLQTNDPDIFRAARYYASGRLHAGALSPKEKWMLIAEAINPRSTSLRSARFAVATNRPYDFQRDLESEGSNERELGPAALDNHALAAEAVNFLLQSPAESADFKKTLARYWNLTVDAKLDGASFLFDGRPNLQPEELVQLTTESTWGLTPAESPQHLYLTALYFAELGDKRLLEAYLNQATADAQFDLYYRLKQDWFYEGPAHDARAERLKKARRDTPVGLLMMMDPSLQSALGSCVETGR